MSGGLVLVRSDIEGIFLLNPTSELLWKQRADGFSAAESAFFFSTEFHLPVEQAKQDVESALANWSTGLLGPAPPRAAATVETPVHPHAVVLHIGLNSKTFRITIDPGPLEEEIAPRLAHLAIGAPPEPDFVLNAGGADLPSAVRLLLLSEITRLSHADERLLATLHAGACGTDRECVLLAGAGHAGKSTLCAALVNAGLLCYSDDSVLVFDGFRIPGMNFPIMLRAGSWPYVPNLPDTPVFDRYGASAKFVPSNLPAHSSPVAKAKALVFVDYQPGAANAFVELDTFGALVELERTGFWLNHQQNSIKSFLSQLAEIPVYRLTYSALDFSISSVAGLLT